MTILDLPKPLECPRSWKYTEDWCKKYNDKHGADYLSDICKHSSAGFRIMYAISEKGEMALTKIKTQNLYIKRLSAGSIDPRKIDDSDIDWQSGATWIALQEYMEELFDVYNADLAPPEIQSILRETGIFINQGQKHCQELLLYISNSQHLLTEKDEAANEALRNLSSTRKSTADWQLVDAKHTAITDGIIYLLSNPLMPGVFKIGFTAGNPDKRAREISTQYGLPMSFEVVQYWRTKDPYIVEQRIHSELAMHAKAGEFFEVGLQRATDVIQLHISAIQAIIRE